MPCPAGTWCYVYDPAGVPPPWPPLVDPLAPLPDWMYVADPRADVHKGETLYQTQDQFYYRTADGVYYAFGNTYADRVCPGYNPALVPQPLTP